jgi:hypothetical protein
VRTVRVRVAFAAATLLIAIVAPVPAYAATPTTTEFTLETVDPQFGQETCLQLSTTVTAGGGEVTGAVTVYDTTSGSDVFWFDQTYSGGSTIGMCFPQGFSVGTHSYRADYAGNATYEASSGTLEFEIPKMTPQFFMSTLPVSPDAGSSFEITAQYITPHGFAEEDFLEVHLDGVEDPICSGAVHQGEWVTCTVTAPSTPGTYHVTLSNSGTASVEAASSGPLDLVVQPNIVHASNVKVQYSTFYPVNDGYRDTVAITGTRAEPIAVTIKIYSPGGSLIKTQTIASGTGAYSWKWNGRTSDGTVRPEGKYKITQRLQDGGGASETSTFFVNLSRKKLIWHSTSITKNGSAFAAWGASGDGKVTKSSDGWVRLKAPLGISDWAGAGWQFSLASGLGYKDVVVKVYAKRSTLMGESRLGAQDFSECAITAGWNESCFKKWKGLGGAGSIVWTTSNELTASYISGTKVRSLVSVWGNDVYVYKARVSYKYATLGY